jgi:hypothetical protein
MARKSKQARVIQPVERCQVEKKPRFRPLNYPALDLREMRGPDAGGLLYISEAEVLLVPGPQQCLS